MSTTDARGATDPLNRARQIVDDRLVRLVSDGPGRWDIATAIVTNLDMAGLIITSDEQDLAAENAELRQDWAMHEAAWRDRVAELEARTGSPNRPPFHLTDEDVVFDAATPSWEDSQRLPATIDEVKFQQALKDAAEAEGDPTTPEVEWGQL